MVKKILIGVIVLIVVAAGVKVYLSLATPRAQKVYRVGVLSGLNFVADITDGLKARMADLGYVEGKNVVYDVQRTDFDMIAYQRALKKFVDERVDVIVVFPTEASIEAKRIVRGTGIPVVFTFALIEDMGLVNSIREPGGNITGVRYPGPDIVLQRFEIMRELAPQAKRFLIPYQRGYPIVGPQLEILRTTAAAAGIALVEIPADNAAELKIALDARATSTDVGVDAVLIIVEPLAVTPDAFEVMGEFAHEHQLPVGGALMETEGYQSLFGVNVDTIAVGRQTAPLVNKVLRGAPAGTIPVVSAEPYFQLNYTAAQKLGLAVPEGLLNRANEIVR